MIYKQKYHKYKNKYRKISFKQRGGNPCDNTEYHIETSRQHFDNLPLNQPPKAIPETQSLFYMPLISTAYYVVRGQNIPKGLYESIGNVIKIFQIDDKEISFGIFKILIYSICDYLHVDNNLQNLEQYYNEKDESPPTNGMGHISAQYQEAILHNSQLSDDNLEFIIYNINDKNTKRGLEIGIRDVQFVIDTFIQNYYINNKYYQTDFQTDGGIEYKNIHLSSHNIRCDSPNVLKQFKLNRQWVDNNPTGNINYEYTCTDNLRTDDPNHQLYKKTNMSTNLDYDGMGNTIYLDRHHVKCGPSEALSGFQLKKNNDSNIKYDYECRDGLYDLTTHHTNFEDDGNGQNVYLDRHDVKCPSGKVLNSFQLKRNDDGDKYRYDYTCGYMRNST